MSNNRRSVTPEEAQGLAEAMEPLPPIFGDLAHTVATEPDRTRAAVVKVLREVAGRQRDEGCFTDSLIASDRADAIEAGGDL